MKKEISESTRVPLAQKKKIMEVGDGSFRQGLTKLLTTFEMINKDPSILLLKEFEHFSGMIKAFASENHYEHYLKSNLPALLRSFITSGRVDTNILNGRVEKPIDSFHKEGKKDEE